MNKKNALFFVGMVLLVFAASRLQAGQIYKSFDAEGHVVYSDHADPSVKSSIVQPKAPQDPSTLPSGADAAAPTVSSERVADTDVSTAVIPPPLPYDPQPVASQDGYLWTPGYWYWSGEGYAWVPGVWAQPPRVGAMWTPAYWGLLGAVYVFHPGYWGSHVGFYGGIDYGFGYHGTGYTGGRWVGNTFAYNSSVNHLNPSVIRNTYAEPVAHPAAGNLASYNGGRGGTTAIPTAQELSAAMEPHIPATPATGGRQSAQRLIDVPAAPRLAQTNPKTHSTPQKPAVINQSALVRTRAIALTPLAEQRSTATPPKSNATPAPRLNRATPSRAAHLH